MKDYTAGRLRNVFHVARRAGKTTWQSRCSIPECLTDCKVNDGNTTMDYDLKKSKEKFLSAHRLPCEWKDHKINIIDTPGYFDFVGEVKQATRVADAPLYWCRQRAAAVGTEVLGLRKEQDPENVFVSKMDEEHANFFEILDQLRDTFGKSVIAFQLPILEGEKFVDMLM